MVPPLGWRFEPSADGKPPPAWRSCRPFRNRCRNTFSVLVNRERTMTVIVVTQDRGVCEPQIAARIAAGLGLELVSREQLGHRVAARMDINEQALRRLIEAWPPLFTRWLGERRRLAFYTAEEVATLARQGDVVIESWNPVGSVAGIRDGIRLHIGESRHAVRLGTGTSCCQAAISPLEAPPARKWRLDQAQSASIVCELVLAPAPEALERCLIQLRQFAFGLPRQGHDPEESFAAAAAEAAEAPSPATPWSRARGTEVDIGSERMPLDGVTSPEQAIAKIEERLHGRRRPPARLPLPPDML
jgi:hypothetical protein